MQRLEELMEYYWLELIAGFVILMSLLGMIKTSVWGSGMNFDAVGILIYALMAISAAVVYELIILRWRVDQLEKAVQETSGTEEVSE